MKKDLDELLKLKHVEELKQIQFNGNTYDFTHKNNGVIRGNGVFTAYNFRCKEESHNLTLYVSNDVVNYAESGYSRS